MLEEQEACFNAFPYQCVGCSEYTETRQYRLSELTLLAGIANSTAPEYEVKVVKECRRFRKRKIEYLK